MHVKTKSTEPLFSLANVSAQIRGKSLLQNCSLDIFAGDLLMLVGPNGAGKSSLLRAVHGDIAFQGRVDFEGQCYHKLPLRSRATRVAVLQQYNVLNFPFTVREVVALGRLPHDCGVNADREQIMRAAAATDVSHLLDRKFTHLSGGEKQRVHLARCFAQLYQAESARPCALFLDEPMAALDLMHQKILLQRLREFADNGNAVVVVSHDLSSAMQNADRVVMLNEGRILAHGMPQDILTTDRIRDVFGLDVEIFRHPKTHKAYLSWA